MASEPPALPAFVCPCCGHRTLPDRPGTLAALCEVCAWEGRDPEGWFRFAGPALVDAQREYLRTGVCDPALAAFARPPRPEEARPAWWLPLEETRAALLAAIEQAYATVELDGGISMAEASLIDDHALPSRGVDSRPPRGHGIAPPWQDLTRAYFERYHWGPFPFMEARGFRYYLPALLRFDLLGQPPTALESLVFCLTEHNEVASIHQLLDDAQRLVVARYFFYQAMVDGWVGERSARAALRRGWGAYLDPDQLAQLPGE